MLMASVLSPAIFDRLLAAIQLLTITRSLDMSPRQFPRNWTTETGYIPQVWFPFTITMAYAGIASHSNISQASSLRRVWDFGGTKQIRHALQEALAQSHYRQIIELVTHPDIHRFTHNVLDRRIYGTRCRPDIQAMQYTKTCIHALRTQMLLQRQLVEKLRTPWVERQQIQAYMGFLPQLRNDFQDGNLPDFPMNVQALV